MLPSKSSLAVPMLRRWILAIAVSLGAAPILGGGAIALNPTDRFEAGECPFDVAEVMGDRPVPETQCGRITVPERHGNPTGNTIRLGVAVFKSPNPNAAADPLVIAQGGPGASILELAPYLLPDLQGENGWLRDRDVVLVEQRGTRYSEPFLFCRELYDFSVENASRPNSEELQAALYSAVGQCRDRLVAEGVDLGAYNSLENASDMVAAIDALGYGGPFNFYGISYGTMLGQHLMRDHGDRLRSVVLDSVAPLDISFIEGIPKNTDRVLRKLFDACNADPTCRDRYPNLREQLFTAIAFLNETPIPVQLPNIGKIQEDLAAGVAPELVAGPAYQVPALLDGDSLLASLNASFYVATEIPKLPQAIAEFEQGNYAGVLRVLPALVFSTSQADGMYNSVLCAEDMTFTLDAIDTDGIDPALREILIKAPEGMIETCNVWQVPSLPDRVNEPVRSEIPTLLLSGDLDQITPPEFGDRVAATLPRSRHYVFPDRGHTLIGNSRCAAAIVGDFLREPTATPDDDCVADLKLEFTYPSAIATEPLTIPALGLQLAIPQGWQQDDNDAPVWSELGENGLPTGRAIVALGGFELPPEALLNFFPYAFRTAESRTYGDRTWQIHPVDNPAAVSAVATTQINGLTYAIAVDSDALWHRDAVLEAVLTTFRAIAPAAN